MIPFYIFIYREDAAGNEKKKTFETCTLALQLACHMSVVHRPTSEVMSGDVFSLAFAFGCSHSLPSTLLNVRVVVPRTHSLKVRDCLKSTESLAGRYGRYIPRIRVFRSLPNLYPASSSRQFQRTANVTFSDLRILHTF